MVCTVAVGIIVFLFYLSCYLCDMHRIEAEALYVLDRGLGVSNGYESATSGRIDWEEWNGRGLFWRLGMDYSEQEGELDKLFSRRLAGALWFSVDMDSEIHLSHGEAAISYEGTWHVPLERMFFINGGVDFSGEFSRSCVDNCELIRIVGGIVRGFGD
ncbi:MAG: hypothetical protein K6F92_06575 [Lachnospiraceae bacterium]|nr:hypothetical protein [Lachnospiraceae bacterium]